MAELILVLEDEETLRYVQRFALTALGHEVVTAGSVEEALRLVAEHSFSAAVLDLVLPDGSGIRVLDALKTLSPDSEVIIMTGHASVETAVEAIRRGAYDYLEKPVDLDHLGASVTRMLERRQLLRSNRELLRDLEQRNLALTSTVQRLDTLNAAGTGMGKIGHLPQLFGFVLDLVVKELDVDRASIMLLDEEGDLRIAAAHGIEEEIVQNTRVRIGEGIVGKVVETGTPLLVDDVAARPEQIARPRTELANSFVSAPIQLSVPIKSDAILGAISVTNRRSGAPFTSQDVEYLLGLGGQAAVAIERTRRSEQLQSAVATLAATRDQLEEAAALRNQFLGNISHELRTPLSGILGFLELSLEDASGETDQRSFVEQALECGHRLREIIDDVLTITNIESAHHVIRGRGVDVSSVLQEVERTLRPQAARKGLAMRFEIVEPFSQQARGDTAKLRQTLLSLVGNAIKFTRQGEVHVRASAPQGADHVRFEIEDTGIGIAPEHRKKIFEKFTQVDGGRTREFGGTGLGLPIAKRLVEMMGGVIDIESPGLNQGTRVHFTLPVWRPSEEGGEPVTAGTAPVGRIEGPLGGALVLVVEDDHAVRRWMTTVLTRHGLRTVEAADAETASMLLRRLRPSAVIVDHALPASGKAKLRSGWDLARSINADAESKGTPIVFVTGFEAELQDRLERETFVRAPVCLRKPLDAEKFLRVVSDLTESASERRIRVLLADTDPVRAATIRRELPASRCHLEVANGGEECLEVLRAQPRGFDVFVVDLGMPDLSGVDVLLEMSESGLAPDLPVVAMTAPGTKAGDRKSVAARVAEFVPRPSRQNPGSIRDAVERCAAGAGDESETRSAPERKTRSRAA